MCPFGATILSMLANDANFGMSNADMAEDVAREARRWGEKISGDQLTKTSARIALATAVCTTAVLGRAGELRTLESTIAALKGEYERLFLLRTEQKILSHLVDDNQTGSVKRAECAWKLSERLQGFLAASSEEEQRGIARCAGELFFTFAQRECGLKGHGLLGLQRAVGIVIGEVRIEEVVFG